LGESTLFVDDQLGLQVVNLALREGFISSDEWKEALAQHTRETTEGRPRRSICAILLARGALTRAQLRELRKRAERRHDRDEAAPRPTRESATFGKYLLLHELGQGARGSVFEALDQELGRRVALKLLRDTPGGDPRAAALARERFLREARVCSALPSHPSIVQILETGVTRGVRYLAMELVRGLEMNRWADGRDRKARVALLRDVARALHEAHEYGFVHRDLKPRNILVDAQNRPHITDFGTARIVRHDSREPAEGFGARLGTALYLSPEQSKGSSSVDRRADVYALGAMLYEALADRPPFEGDPAAPALPGSVDRTLGAICMKAMAREPRDRYATARDLADDLDGWLSGTRVRVRPLGGRRAAAVGGTAALLVLGLVLWPRPEPVPAPAAPAPDALVLSPGVSLEARGVRFREHPDARVEMAVFEGRPCAKLVRNADGFGLLPLDLDDAWARAAAVAEVEVEYFDAAAPGAYFTVQYDSAEERLFASGAYKWAGTLWLEGTREWRRASLRLPNPRFADRQSGGADLRIFAGLSELHVSRVAVRALPAGEAAPLLEGRFPALAPPPPGLLPGLAAEIFAGTNFERRVARRIDPGIAFDWGDSSGPEGLSDRFSVRWTGYLRVPRSGRYLLEAQSDNGVRVLLDDRPVVANWKAHASTTDLALCELEEGFHRIVVEYFEEEEAASVLFACHEERDGRLRSFGPESLFHR
jgi:predicted Ser/Thr protein kinase